MFSSKSGRSRLREVVASRDEVIVQSFLKPIKMTMVLMLAWKRGLVLGWEMTGIRLGRRTITNEPAELRFERRR